MAEYVDVDDSIIGKKVLYDDRETGIVTGKVSEGNERRGAEYSVMLESGMEVYITDMSLWKFKMIK
jgi:hypothetical protein